MNLQELKQKNPAELILEAEKLGIENPSTMRKQEILFAILKKLAEKNEQITAIGVLEVLQDGFGFLRAIESNNNYLTGIINLAVFYQGMGDNKNAKKFYQKGLNLSPKKLGIYYNLSKIDKDYINVAKVLKLGTFQKIFKVVLPSSLPLIFTGLKITLSVAWMVLIAIELLAQSPGLGLFVWEEFQNGANDSNAKIIVAMFVIGIIGFLLDRLMLTIQNWVSFDKTDAI
jgi:tetratricopeptide (TPR) repeat protein